MRRFVCALLALLVVLAAGCVRREIQIFTRPPGARVQFDGKVLEGRTPIYMPFTWYGTHEIVVEKPGYHRERLIAHVRPPWYERFPIDLFSDLLVPWRIDDIHTYPLVLVKEKPLQDLSDAEKTAIKAGLIERAERFRTMARIRVGTPPRPTPPAPKEPKKQAPEKK